MILPLLIMAIIWPDAPIIPEHVWEPLPLTRSGWVSQYAERPTIYTIIHNQDIGIIPHDLTPYDGVVAVEECWHVGKSATLTIDDTDYHVLIFDCQNPTLPGNWMREEGIIVEVGYYLAERHGFVGRGGVRGTLSIKE